MDHSYYKKNNTFLKNKTNRNSEDILNGKIFRKNIKNPIFDLEDNLIALNKNTVKDNDFLELSKVDKNINNFLTNYLKSYTLNERRKSKPFIQGIKNLVNNHIEKGSSDLLKLKKLRKNSTKNILTSLMNRSSSNNSNEANSFSYSYLIKKDSDKNIRSIESYEHSPINSLNINYLNKYIFRGMKNEKKNNNKLAGKIKINEYNNDIKTKSLNISKSCNSKSTQNIVFVNSPKKINKKEYLSVKQKCNDRNCQSDIMDERYELPYLLNNGKKFISPKNKRNNISSSRCSASPKENKSDRLNLKSSRSLKTSKNGNENDYHFSLFFNIAHPKNLKYRNSFSPKSISDKNNNINKIDNNLNVNAGSQKSYQNEIIKKTDKKRNNKQRKKKLSSSCLRDEEKSNLTPTIRRKTNTISDNERLSKKNLFSILRTNKPNETENTNKIMDIITMDEVNKKLKESIISIDKKELKKELKKLETNDICEAIAKLPVVNPNVSFNSNNFDNSLNSIKSYSSGEDTNRNNFENKENLSNKAKYRFSKNKSISINTNPPEKLINKKEIFRNLKHKKIIYDSLDDEEIEEVENNTIYISPNSLTALLLDSIILISSLIGTLYFPIFFAKRINFCRKILDFNGVIFYFIDLFYIIDFIAEFFKAYYNFDEYLVKNKNDIFKNYLKSWFITDFIEAIPIYTILNIFEKKCRIDDAYYYSSHYNTGVNNMQYELNILKTLKIFKVSSKNIALKKIKNIINENDFLFKYQTILSTLFIVFNCINISSCIFINLGKSSYPGWITENNLQNSNFAYIYLTAIYYLITTITTVGYGDILVTSISERIYQIIIIVIGTCAYSWSLTYISNYIKKIQEKYLVYNQKMSILQEIKMQNPHLTDELYHKIQKHLRYNSFGSKNSNEILINCLPYPLKNSLFIEMYKPIINNFNIFKYSFENTNFIVKVVTSFKYVLSVKGDILMEEDDFVEDVFFVKEGVLSLEICINLNYEKESIEALLNESGLGKTNFYLQKKITNKFNSFNTSSRFIENSSFKNTLSKTFTSCSINPNRTEQNMDEINKRYLKIISIRKNEHFGEILMFLNERAPLRAKVISKKAELYLLNKTDAIEISTLYPNIWKRIIKTSLYNMKQIKNISRKILIDYSKKNGIKLNNDLNNETSDISSCNLSKSDDIGTFSNFSERYQIKKGKRRSQKRKILSSIIYEEESENGESAGNGTIISTIVSNKKNHRNSHNKSNSSLGKYKFKSTKKLDTFTGENNYTFLDFNYKENNSKLYDTKFKTFKTDLYKKNLSSSEFSSNKLNRKELIHNFLLYKNSKNKSNKKIRKISVDLLENNKMKKFKEKFGIQNLEIYNIKKGKLIHNHENNDGASSEKVCDSKNPNLSIDSSDSDDNINILTPFKKKEVNDEIYQNERFIECKFLRNDSSEIKNEEENNQSTHKVNIISEKISSSDYEKKDLRKSKINSKIIDNKFTFVVEKSLLKKDNINHKDNLESDAYNNSKIKEKNIDFFIECSKNGKIKTFDKLCISRNYFMTIKSSYCNIDQLTKYKFHANLHLQNKIKEFILKECHALEKSSLINNNINSNNCYSSYSIKKTNALSEIKSNGSYFSPRKPKRNSKFKSKNVTPQIKIKNDSTINYLSLSNSIKENTEPKIEKDKIYSKSPRREKNKLNNDINHTNIQKRYKRNSVLHKSNKLSLNTQKNSINETNNLDALYDTKKKINKKKSQKFTERESNFYGKIKTIITNNNNTVCNNIKNFNDKKNIDYLDKISHNISENKQALQNPQEFYTGFFTNIINKQKYNRRKSSRDKRNNNNLDANNIKTNEDVDKNKEKNNINITTMLNQNKRYLKRNSTTNESLMRSNIDIE